MTDTTNRKLDILRILMNCLLACSVTLAAQMTYMQCGGGVRARDLLMIVYVLAAEVISTKFRNLVPVTVIHAVLLAAMWLLGPTMPEAIARCAVGLIIYGISVRRGITHEKSFAPRIWWLLYGAILYFYATVVGKDGIHTVAYLSEVGIVMLTCAWYNELSLQTALVGMNGTENIPHTRIRELNRILLAGSMLLMGILSGIVILTDFGQNLLSTIKQGIISVLRALILWIRDHGWEPADYTPQTDGGVQSTSEQVPMALQELGGEVSPFMERLSDIVMVICAVIIVGAFAYMLVRAIRAIYKGYDRSKGAASEKVETVRPRKKESSAYESGIVKPLRFLDRSPSAKVRRMYMRYLKKGHGFAKIRRSYTPYELEMTAYSLGNHKERSSGMDEIHRLYEKARYQTQECTASDSERMKEVLDRQR